MTEPSGSDRPEAPRDSAPPAHPTPPIPASDFEYQPKTQAHRDGGRAPLDWAPADDPGPAAPPEAVASQPSPEVNPPTAQSPLTEHYVAVTLGNVPLAQRDIAEPALRAAIQDEIEHRHSQLLGDEATTRSDIEVDVLEDMGDPEQVAAAMTHRPKVLIGPRFYHDYKYILGWALVLVLLAAGAIAMGSAVQDGAEQMPMILRSLGVGLTAMVYAAAWITVSFSIAERVARHRAEVAAAEWRIDHLPAPTRTIVSVSQTAVAVVASLVAAVAIVVQQLNPATSTNLNVPVVFLNPDHWPWVWSALVVALAVNALVAIRRHVRGHWVMRTAGANVALLTVIYGIMAWMLATHSFLNVAFFDEVGWPTADLPPARLEDWALIAVGVLWLFGVALGFGRAWRARSS